MDRTIYVETIHKLTNAERWQAELIADLAMTFGDDLEKALDFSKGLFGERADA